jgi:peptidoglycan/xylan/chitin deacetylase (PgdA/CDA1 family)
MPRTAFLAACLVSSVALSIAAGCSSTPSEDDPTGSEDELSNKNLAGTDFGLAPKEIVLTIDDGPGPRTPELVDFLVQEQVPAIFFMVGKNAKANPAAVEKVAANATRVPGNLIIGNHSMNHSMTPLPNMGRAGAQAEILQADAILHDAIAKAQSNLPNVLPFFRPPFGAFTALGAANIATLNQTAAGQYVGPVFWNIGGELTATHSADWACWGSHGRTIDACIDGYVREANDRGRGLMLVHDVHSKTIDMLTGAHGGRSLIKVLRAAGFKFVGIRSHDDAVLRFASEQQQLQASSDVDILAKTSILDDGQVEVSVESSGADSLKIVFDDGAQPARVTREARPILRERLNPGQHVVTVIALDAAGRVLKAEKSTFVVPSAIDADSPEGRGEGHPACVDFAKLKKGRTFDLYHDAVACGAGAKKPIGIDQCYRFLGSLTASRDPALVGADEWSIEFDLSYLTDPSDKSKMSFVVDSQTGEIVTGRRSWSGTAKAPVAITSDSVDCNSGIWRGTMHYANGKTEALLFRAGGPGDKPAEP